MHVAMQGHNHARGDAVAWCQATMAPVSTTVTNDRVTCRFDSDANVNNGVK